MRREEVLAELLEKVKQEKLDEIETLGFKKEGEEWVGYGLKVKVWREGELTFMEVRKVE